MLYRSDCISIKWTWLEVLFQLFCRALVGRQNILVFFRKWFHRRLHLGAFQDTNLNRNPIDGRKIPVLRDLEALWPLDERSYNNEALWCRIFWLLDQSHSVKASAFDAQQDLLRIRWDHDCDQDQLTALWNDDQWYHRSYFHLDDRIWDGSVHEDKHDGFLNTN